MESGSGEKSRAVTLERRGPESGGTEFTEGVPSCSLGGEDVAEERLSRVQKEVIDLAEKVVEYREKGPLAFALRLEKSLAQMRSSIPSVEPHVKRPTNPEGIEVEDVSTDKEVLAQRAKLMERLAAAKASLPTILLELNTCKDRLDKAITARTQSPSRHLQRHPPPVP